MELNDHMRGILENLIDQTIGVTPMHLNMVRKNIPPEFGIQNNEDYILGVAQGVIIGLFLGLYRGFFAQDPPPNVMAEAGRIIYKRTREIREAIFKAG
ncbi:MAG TPA: hypothetical protein VHJ38_11515 [Nitrososphaeraceae archaeon]|jgi:hypothetical protein|nr:hypothetical protein [Nitrososphaeraceae archaeon]